MRAYTEEEMKKIMDISDVLAAYEKEKKRLRRVTRIFWVLILIVLLQNLYLFLERIL